MAVIYSDELQKNHYAPFLSKTTCITYTLFLLMIALPAFLVYRTHSKLKTILFNWCDQNRFLDQRLLPLRAACRYSYEWTGCDRIYKVGVIPDGNHITPKRACEWHKGKGRFHWHTDTWFQQRWKTRRDQYRHLSHRSWPSRNQISGHPLDTWLRH